MHRELKERIVKAVDLVLAAGREPTALMAHPDTAADMAMHGTHVDLGSEYLLPTAEQIAAELTHPKYDERPTEDPHHSCPTCFAPSAAPCKEGCGHDGARQFRPKADEVARRLSATRCHAHLRRIGVVLEVRLDRQMETGKIKVISVPRATESTEEV